MKKIFLFFLIFCPSVLFAQHPDISSMMSEYKGAESCIVCHPSGSKYDIEAIAKQVTKSAHFQFQVDVGNDQVFDHSNETPITGKFGKYNRYCGLPGSIPAINWIGLMQNPAAPFNNQNAAYPNGAPGGCSRCHVGNGTKTIKQLEDEDAWKTVDCMLCHAQEYTLNGKVLNNYGARLPVVDTSSATGFHMPYLSGDDLKATSVSISSQPTNYNCQNCHAWAGGGYTNKRGHDFDGMRGSADITDIHATQGNLKCTDCHITKEHKIGMGRIKPACYLNDLKDDPDNAKINCEYCHSTDGQAFFSDLTIPVPAHNGIPSKHFESVSCASCHITNNQGLQQKWFNQIVREIDGNGKFKRWKPKGMKISGQATLKYQWFNGTVYNNVSPRGSKGDGKIHPFKILNAEIPVDDATGIALPIKLGIFFNADSLISNLTGMGVPAGSEESLIQLAIKKGATLAIAADPSTYGSLPNDNGTYNGTYTYHTDIMNFSVDHGVTAKEDALSCVDCHAESGGRINWTELGYSANPYVMTGIEETSDIPTEYQLHQNYPNPFNPTTNIAFALPKRTNVKIKVYDTLGKLVDTIVDVELAPGHFEITYNASKLASGVYFYKLETDDYSASKKFVLVK